MTGTMAEGGDGDAGLRALIQCLVVAAGADKKLTLSEIEVVSALYAEEAGRTLDQALVADVFAQLKDCDPAQALADLRAAGQDIEPGMKERIVQSCYKVMTADRSVDPKERDRLVEIAAALGLTEQRVDRLIRDTRG